MGIQAIEGIEKAMHCVVADVLPGSVAEQAGLQAGDVIRTFDHVRVAGSQHFVALVASRADRTVPLLIERGGKKIELQVTPRVDPVQGRAMIGVRVGSNEMGAMPWMQYRRPLDQIKNDAMGIVRILKALVTPRESRQAAQGLGGPVMILATLWVSIQTSLLNAVGFLRFLNINLAILNLLPIPVLDGGHILIALWEGITRRRVNPRFVNALVNVFAALLIAVFILLTYRDFFRLSRFLRIFRERDERSPAAATNEPPAAPAQERVSP
jgi:regulator of sigma E protease